MPTFAIVKIAAQPMEWLTRSGMSDVGVGRYVLVDSINC
jgi:hypothetical protein